MSGELVKRRLVMVLSVVGVALAAGGCPWSNDTPTSALRPFAGAQVKLLVVDDPELAKAASKFLAEWKVQTGASCEIVEATSDDFASGKAPPVDAMIYPVCQLPGLAQSGRLKAVPREVLADARLSWSDVFETLRLREAVWGGKTYGLPLGSPVLVCWYRADLLEEHNRQPPTTWTEYQELAEFFGDRQRLDDDAPSADAPWSGAVEPLADGWAGLTLLARAASYAKHPDFFSALFDMETLSPLIDSPPFVRALEELAAAHGPAAANREWLDPAGARAAFLGGQCAMCLSWPTAAKSNDSAASPGNTGETLKIGFCALPGSAEVYNPGDKRWSPLETPRSIPLVGIAGRFASVAAVSQQGPAAFQLLVALTGRQWGNEVCSASSATTLFRAEHANAPRSWVEPSIDQSAARQYATLVGDVLNGHDSLSAVSLPGREKYVAALDAAVAKTLAGEATATESLAECADRWRAITKEVGLERQLDVYRNSVMSSP